MPDTEERTRVAPQFWINAALRSVIWLGVAVGWAYLKKPDEASLLAVRTPVTDGPFRYVRNPIYLAGITLLLGVGLLYFPWRAVDLGLPLLLLVYFHVAVVRVEEPELLRRFGSKYKEYCERVPRWLPVPAARPRPR